MPIGYRAFAIRSDGDEVFLAPPSIRGGSKLPLEYPLTRALCNTAEGQHKAPKKACGCGYYAFSDIGGSPDYLHRGIAMVMAEVWGHGRVEVHGMGWRSEKMQIVRFFYPLCDSTHGIDERGYDANLCNEPAAASWLLPHEDESDGRYVPHDFRRKLRFGCEFHAEAVTRLATQRAQREGRLLDASPEAPRPIDEIIRMLVAKFECAVFDYEATVAVFEKNEEWAEAVRFRHERKRQAQREKADAKAALKQTQQTLQLGDVA